MLAACDENIERMAKDEPQTKVGIVCFDSFVHIYGDGTQPKFAFYEPLDEKGLTQLVEP